MLVGKKMYNVKDDVKKKMLEKYRNCFENKYKIDEEYRDKILWLSFNKYKRNVRYRRNLI